MRFFDPNGKNGKIEILGGNFPDSEVAEPTGPNPSIKKIDPSGVKKFDPDPSL